MRDEPHGRQLDAEALRRLAFYEGEWTVLLNHDARIVYELGTCDRVFGGPGGTSSTGRHITSFVCPDEMGLAFDKMAESLASLGSEVAFRIRAGRGDGQWQEVDVLAINRFDDAHINGMVLRTNLARRE